MKIKEFSMDDFNVIEILKSELEKKIKSVSVFGATAKNLNCRIWDIKISEEDLTAFKGSKVCLKLCKEKYNQSLLTKKAEYTRLKAKLDFCLFDVKPYLKLIENIDEFSYCGAISELDNFHKRYLHSSGYTKAKYRARSQEFSKMKCA